MKYRAYVDGLRAIAILPVLFYHAGIGAPGGFVGVDVFFVISGFLITGLILKDIDAGEFRIQEFWQRRVRRILPAVSVVIIATLVAGWFLFLPQNFKELGLSTLWQAMLTANFYFWGDSGYFAQGVDVKPLLHTWSLAVEEQFYLLFPFLLVVVSRFSRKSLTGVIVVLATMSFCLSVWGTYASPSATFYLLPARAWELLLGALLASLPQHGVSRRWLSEAVTYAGLAAILGAVFFYSGDTRFPGAAALLPCVGTVLIIWANGYSLTSAGRVLAMRPVVFIGLISYSLYLWHWPLLVFSKYWVQGKLPPGYRLLIVGASVALAVLSWKFVESPFRKRLVLKTPSRVFAFAISSIAVLLLSGLAIYMKDGLPSRIPPSARQYASGITDRAFVHEMTAQQARKEEFAELGNGDLKQPVSLVVWGDSQAMAAMPVIDALCKEHSIRGVGATHSATAPLIGYRSPGKYSLADDSIPFNDAVLEFVRKNHVRDVILVAFWTGYDDGTDRLHRDLLATVRKLREAGARAWIMRRVPGQQWDNTPVALAAAALRGSNPDEMGRPLREHREKSRREDEIVAGLADSDVTILDPTDCLLSPKGLCRAAFGGYSLYVDGHHLTTHGAMLLRPLFEPVFRRL